MYIVYKIGHAAADLFSGNIFPVVSDTTWKSSMCPNIVVNSTSFNLLLHVL